MSESVPPRREVKPWAPALEYGLAVLLVVLATLFRVLLEPYMGLTVPYVTYFLSNAIIIRFTRLGPSVLAICLSTFAADYFFLPPRFTMLSTPAQWVTSTVFVVANVVILALAHAMRKAKEEAEANSRALRREKGILQAVMDGAKNSHLVYLDRDFNFVRVNETYARSCGYTPEAMVGKNHFALYPHPENEAIFASVRDTGEPVEHQDKPFQFPDQPERGVTYWDWTLTPVKDTRGQVEGLVLSLYETTQRKQAEEAVRQSEERLRAIFDHAGVGIVEVDTVDRFIAVNRRVCQILGYRPEELLGMTVHQLTYPEDRPLSDHLNAQLHEGRREPLDYEKRYLKRDGSPLWVHVTVSPIQDARGEWLRSIATVEDISERKQAEEALRQREQHLQAVFNASQDAITVADDEGQYVDANPAAARLFGVPVERLKGTRIHEYLAGHSDFDGVWREFRQIGRYEGEHALVRADGATLAVETRAVARILPGRHLAVIRDVTERKQMIAELTQTKEELRQHAQNLERLVQERTAKLEELVGELEHFSYTLSHDMRAPLRAMRGFSELMLASGCATCTNCESRDFLQKIVSGATRMDRLMTDALAYSRAVREELPLSPVDVVVLLREMLDTYPNFQPVYADISLEGDFPPVLANEAALTQCFANLLGNAVKFVPPDRRPTVRIRAELREGQRVRLWFEDNGIGIAQEDQKKLFGMFQRLTKYYEGTGIGLALVRKNVEHMGGKVGVESEPGQGSRFWLELKRA